MKLTLKCSLNKSIENYLKCIDCSLLSDNEAIETRGGSVLSKAYLSFTNQKHWMQGLELLGVFILTGFGIRAYSYYHKPIIHNQLKTQCDKLKKEIWNRYGVGISYTPRNEMTHFIGPDEASAEAALRKYGNKIAGLDKHKSPYLLFNCVSNMKHGKKHAIKGRFTFSNSFEKSIEKFSPSFEHGTTHVFLDPRKKNWELSSIPKFDFRHLGWQDDPFVLLPGKLDFRYAHTNTDSVFGSEHVFKNKKGHEYLLDWEKPDLAKNILLTKSFFDPKKIFKPIPLAENLGNVTIKKNAKNEYIIYGTSGMQIANTLNKYFCLFKHVVPVKLYFSGNTLVEKQPRHFWKIYIEPVAIFEVNPFLKENL